VQDIALGFNRESKATERIDGLLRADRFTEAFVQKIK